MNEYFMIEGRKRFLLYYNYFKFLFLYSSIILPCVHVKCRFLFFINRNNLEWLGRATNWAKFTATASLGVIHKVCVTYVGYVGKQKTKKN